MCTCACVYAGVHACVCVFACACSIWRVVDVQHSPNNLPDVTLCAKKVNLTGTERVLEACHSQKVCAAGLFCFVLFWFFWSFPFVAKGCAELLSRRVPNAGK